MVAVNEEADQPATLVAMHEWVHNLRKSDTDLYNRLAAEVRRQGLLPAWAQRMRREGNRTDPDSVVEELTADAVADAFTDPEFLRELGRRDVVLFRQVADSILRFLDSLLGTARDRGTAEYLIDVQAFRDILADAVQEFDARGRRSAGEGGAEPVFQARQEQAQTRTADSGDNLPMLSTIEEVLEAAADSGGVVFVRWSAGPAFDMRPGARSRDYLAGGEHSGLSAVPIRSDMSKAQVAKFLKEYGFLRMRGDVQAHLYAGEQVGTDSDGYPSIRPTRHIGALSDDLVASLDSGLARRLELQDQVRDGEARLARIFDPVGRQIVQARVREARAELARLAPDEADAETMFQRPTNAQRRATALQNKHAAFGQLAALGYPQGSATFNYDAGRWEGRRGALNRARENLQDKLLSMREVERDIESSLGVVLQDAERVYRLENLAHGRVSDQMDKLERDVLEPMRQLMREADLSLDQLHDYLLARHAPERNAKVASINPDMQDGGSGISTADAQAIMAGTKEGPYSGKKLTGKDRQTLAKVGRLLDQMRTRTLDNLERAGTISAQQRQQIEGAYTHYVPLRGKGEADDFGGGNANAGGGGRVDYAGPRVRRALGRGEGNLPHHIFAEMLGDAERAIVGAELARVREGVLRLAQQYPNRDVWQVEPSTARRTGFASSTLACANPC